MIKIKYTFQNGTCIPERELTQEEKLTVTSELTNGSDMTITYFQGDEPVRELPVSNEPEKIDISNIDIDSLTDEQIAKLKTRFGL